MVVAFTWRVFLYGIIYALIPFTSGSFHACEQGYGCIFSFKTHTDLDYIVALLIVPMTTLYLVHWEEVWAPLQDILLVLYILLISFFVNQVETESAFFTAQACIVGSALFIPVIYWIGYFINARFISLKKPKHYFPQYKWSALAIGLCLTVTGMTLFLTQGMFAYQYVADLHGMWHVLCAFGQAYIIQIKAPTRVVYVVKREDWKYLETSIVEQIDQKIPYINTNKNLDVRIRNQK